MSIFSKIKGAKKAAQKHKKASMDQSAQSEKAKEPAIPYRHVPTHAAVDALSGAPSTWRHEDRDAIKQAHTDRMSLKRHNSGYSMTSTAYRNSMQRNSSYVSQATAQDLYRDGSVNSSVNIQGMNNGRPILETRKSRLGYPGSESFEAHQNFRSSRQLAKSPLASTQITPTESNKSHSSRSSSSSQVLELPATLHPSEVIRAAQAQTPHAVFDHVHHPVGRKIGEAPIRTGPIEHRAPAVQAAKPQAIKEKKRSWGFRRSSAMVAAH